MALPIIVEGKIAEIFADIPAVENPKPKDVIMVPGNDSPVVGILSDPECPTESVQVLWKSDTEPREIDNTLNGFMTDLVKDIISRVMSERLSVELSAPADPLQ